MSEYQLEAIKAAGIETADYLWPQDAPHSFEDALEKAELVILTLVKWYQKYLQEVKDALQEQGEG